MIQVLFFIGLLFGAALFIPQIIKLIHAKNSEGVSIVTFLGFTCIQFLVIAHGFYHRDHLLIIGTVFRLIACTILVGLIILYRFKNYFYSVK